MIRIIKSVGKVIIAGITAGVVISLLLCVYSITPVHVENANGNTDYVWQSKSIWVKMTEGISFGRYDEKGYNNKTVIENPDIIVVGSSHMEATNVMQDENASYLLSKRLNDKYSIYNMGISGHNFPKICQYLPRNMELFDTVPKVTIMETGSVQINSQNVEEIINSSVEHTPSHSSGIIGMLQKIPFCRLIYQQIEGGLIDLFMPPREAESNLNEAMVEDVPSESKVSESIDYAAYDELFSYLEKIESEYGTQIVIFYHPFETIQSGGVSTMMGIAHT